MLNTPKKLITLKEVIALTGLSRSTIYKYISTREFPQQIPIGERSVRWEGCSGQGKVKCKVDFRED